MPGALTKYHRKFLPKPSAGSFFSKEMTGLRTNQAKKIKALRSQLGRKQAKQTIASSYASHVKSLREKAARSKPLPIGRSKQYAKYGSQTS